VLSSSGKTALVCQSTRSRRRVTALVLVHGSDRLISRMLATQKLSHLGGDAALRAPACLNVQQPAERIMAADRKTNLQMLTNSLLVDSLGITSIPAHSFTCDQPYAEQEFKRCRACQRISDCTRQRLNHDLERGDHSGRHFDVDQPAARDECADLAEPGLA